MKRRYTTKELAAAWGIGPTSVWRRIKTHMKHDPTFRPYKEPGRIGRYLLTEAEVRKLARNLPGGRRKPPAIRQAARHLGIAEHELSALLENYVAGGK